MATIGVVAFSAAVALIINAAMNEQTPSAWLWLLGMAGIGTRLLANFWRDRIAQTLSASVRTRLRDELTTQATQRGPHLLAHQGNTAWWAHQCLEQIDALHGYLARYLPARQATAVIPVIIIAVTLATDWIAGLLILLATPIIPIFMILIGWGTESVHRAQQEQQSSLAAHLMDRLQALPWLRRMGAVRQTELGVEQAAQDYRKISMRVLRVAFLSSATLEFFSAVSIGLMAIYIGFALIGLVSFGPADQITLATGLFILMLAPECFTPLRQLAQAHHDMNAAKASAEVLQSLFSDPTDQTTQTPNMPQTKSKPNISADPDPHIAARMDNVTLTWPDAHTPLLANIDLNVHRGEILGIAGDSGQGKSTLIHLLTGFIAPAFGRVTRDAHWALLAQRPHLFHATLRDNLLLGSQTTLTDEDLESALSKVGLPIPNPLLPRGLDTQIGETNQGVSGGQAQRIALCRAMISGATLWLLDEPTAALDADTRDSLLNAILLHAKAYQVTLIIASHDSEVLARCDRVVTIAHGKLEVRT
ncbi:MAG: thiol reductant ABC exporter subunit CydD [Burkholderiaceae bacterium]|nr:thiol reductant ABC exporter subunit CydD [Burkholderiaceae bacterium]MCD8516135.1 thiol reductant ABC exporter subunit CydD [Burkholderiaceae bacterium]MCD8537836.1 thiol reductant ABC exporter subunit CydD [Burkholderiaceae bacterium]MCD8566143.1 thiol reductant ABC exporter subunit CydD [Burkholderiaceae bacterium]